MYYAFAAGLRAVLGRYWLGSMLGSADFVRCRSGLGLGFWRDFCISSSIPLKALNSREDYDGEQGCQFFQNYWGCPTHTGT